MSSLKTLNKLPSTRAFSAAEKWTVRSTGVGGFISPQNGTCDAKNSNNIICLVRIGFEKRGTNRK